MDDTPTTISTIAAAEAVATLRAVIEHSISDTTLLKEVADALDSSTRIEIGE